MAEEKLIKHLERYIEYLSEKGLEFEKVYLYGSYAKGTNESHSDVDVLLVDSCFDKPGHDELVGKIWRLTYLFDSRIEPYTIGKEKFNSDDTSPLVEIVKQEGIEIRA